MNITAKSIVGELVAADYRTASVFKHNKIDFCCKGNRTIAEACQNTRLEVDQLIKELSRSVEESADSTVDFAMWDSDLLADYIEKKHHRYVSRKIPELKAYLHKVAKVHGQRHPELIEVEKLFSTSAQELLAHMEKEERLLFPYIRAMANDEQSDRPPFEALQDLLSTMMNEHDQEGERFRKIADLSNNYTAPADACATYKVAFAMLREFEEDLHMHIHLENNILFPGVTNVDRN